MSKQGKHFYDFGGFSFDVENQVLSKEGQPVPLQPKAVATLLVLIENRGQVLSKEQLMQRLWPDSFVEEANLSQNIYVLRKVLGHSANGEEFIRTIPKRGYQFVADVQELGDTDLIIEEYTRTRVVTEEVCEERGLPTTAHKQAGIPARLSAVRRSHVAFVVLTLIAAIGSGFFIVSRINTTKQSASAPQSAVLASAFQLMNLKRLTDLGKITHPVISPDGKYIAYVLHSDGADKTSVWVKHIASGSAKEIVPAAEKIGYEAPIFSPDGSFVYFLRRANGMNSLYRVAVLGDSPRKLIEDVWGRVAPSPDGQRLAFVRVNWNEGKHTLLIANADGTGETPLATRKSPEYFNVFGIGPSWSPDGKTIACSGGTAEGGKHDDAILVDVGTGTQRLLSRYNWHSMGQVVWLPQSAALLVPATEKSGDPQQIWQLSCPGGEIRRVTNDLSDYEMLSLTTDGSTLVGQQSEQSSNLWVMERDFAEVRVANHPSRNVAAKQITSALNRRDGFYGIAWTHDGRIVYSSNASGHYDLWVINSDGQNEQRLTESRGESNIFPSISPDGRFIVFSSDRSGENNIWRVDADGRNLLRLTSGKNEYHSTFSPDGQWVIYESSVGSAFNLWKVPIDGGEPIPLPIRSAGSPLISPDGNLIAFTYFDDRADGPWRLDVMSLEGGAELQSFPQPFRCFDWIPGSHTLTYIVGINTVSNLWTQPVDGAPPRQLTDFTDQRIYCFEWSPDGKHIALARGNWKSDAVMISNLR
jgi:Tol biopolymer transport system component/DNA-binding winged helix-turn-helix (wHTH) protein